MTDVHEGGTEAGLRLSVAAAEETMRRQRRRQCGRHVGVFFCFFMKKN
jgi:hypothetical protein